MRLTRSFFLKCIAAYLCIQTYLIVYIVQREDDNLVSTEDDVHNAPDYCLGTTEVQDDDPCKSPKSLTAYLKKKSDWKFSKHNPVCPFSAKNRVHVLIPLYNLKESVIKQALTSVIYQQYSKDLLHIWVYDDGSDSTTNLNNVCCGEENVFDFPPGGDDVMDDRMHVLHELNRHNLKADNIPSMMCFRSSKHLGPGGGKYWLFRLVHGLAGANDVVIVLDGDDSLLPRAVQTVNQKYIDDSAWFTYGSYEGKWSDQTQPLPIDIKRGENKFDPRNQTWRYGHPRTFKAHLLDYIERTDFTYYNGSWLTKSSDRGFVYKMLELSGVDRVSYIPQKIYKYNFSKKTSTLAQVSESVKVAQTLHTQSIPSSSKLELPIHIILLTWKGLTLLEHQLRWLQQQTDLDNRQIHLHIVNNNWDERNSIKAIVDNFISTQTHNGNLAMNITITHNGEKDGLFHCFARFQYVDKLRQSVPLDSVIFVDDDQYWVPTFVSSLLKEHKPKGMTTWYGKIFKQKYFSVWQPANYWKSDLEMKDIMSGVKYDKYPLFKYGGPGGSIIDANLWSFRHQLMRLQSDLEKWSKIDDIWLSYVIDALLGWEIRRLRPPTVPIDMGDFHAKEIFREEVTVKYNLITKQTAEHLMEIKTSKDTYKMGTYKALKVDKVGMFEELQVAYRWDVFDEGWSLKKLMAFVGF